MWKKVRGRLVQTTDTTRVKFRTNISKEILDRLENMADQYGTHVNYLIENGLEEVLKEGVIHFSKELRPKDRVQYKTSYDRELLEKTKEFAAAHKIFINDVIEYSAGHINTENIKSREHRYRIE
jgi:hypothetical protein